MNRKIIALALGSLLAFIPGAALAQMNTGGTQTYTVPRLTVNPGPFTLSGTMTVGGDFELGGDLIFEGSTADAFETTLTVTDPTADRTITLPNLTGDVMLGNATQTLAGFTNTSWTFGGNISMATTGEINLNGVAGATLISIGNQSDSVAIGQSGDTRAFFDVDGDGIVFELATVGEQFRLDSTDFTFGNATNNDVINIDPAVAGAGAFGGSVTSSDLTAARTWTFPDLTGTVLLGGATNTLGAVTTTINSGTQFNIHSDGNITLDGDADNDGTGTVSILSSNDTQQVLLTNTAIGLVSDAQISATSDDAGGNVNTFTAAAAIGSWEVTDGTDTGRMQIDASGILLDGDYDNDGSGVVTLSTDNNAHSVGLDADSVDIVSDAAINATIGTTVGVNLTPDTVLIDADVDNDADGTVTLSADNSASVVLVGNLAVTTTADYVTSAGRVALLPQDFDVADSGDGNPGVGTLNPTRGTVICNCADADGCTVTMGEVGAISGMVVDITTETATPNLCNFADTGGVSELAGAFGADQWDTLRLVYIVDRWVEVSRSNN